MNLKTFRKVIRNSVLSDIEYRFDYLVLLLSTVLTLVMEWAVFKHVFEGREVVGGFPKTHAFAFILFGMAIRTTQVLWGNTFEMIDEIRDGTFRRYLLQPIFHPFYFLARSIGSKINSIIAITVICLVYKFALGAPESFLTLSNLIPTLLSFAISCLILWSVYLCIIYISFYLEESHFLIMTVNISIGIFSGTLLPLSWLPPWLKTVLQFTPLPLLGDWPLKTALGLLSYQDFLNQLLLAGGWLVLMNVFISIIYKKGMKRYEAFGG